MRLPYPVERGMLSPMERGMLSQMERGLGNEFDKGKAMKSLYDFSKVLNPNPGWYKGDFHLHTNASLDGFYPPSLVAEIAKAEGLDFIAITDHNTIEGYKALREDLETLVIPGLEITFDRGHCNVFGMEAWRDWMAGICGDKIVVPLPSNYDSVNALISRIAKEGMLTSINHPLLAPWQWQYEDTDLRQIDCVELWNDLYWPPNADANPNTVQMWNRWLNAGHRITAIGGSDYHYPPRPEEGKPGERLGYPATYVYADELSGAGILAGLRGQRAYVSKGPQVSLTAEINGQRYGIGEDVGDQAGEITFEVSVVSNLRSKQAQLVKNGQVLAEAQAEGERAELIFGDRLKAGERAWYRLDVCGLSPAPLSRCGEATDMTPSARACERVAITNPIFCGPREETTLTRYSDFLEAI